MAQIRHQVVLEYRSNQAGLQKAESQLKKLQKLRRDIASGKAELPVGMTMDQLERKIKNATAARQKYLMLIKKENQELSLQNRLLQKGEDIQEKRNRSIMGRTKKALGQAYLEAPLYASSFALMSGIATSFRNFVEIDKILTRIAIVTEKNTDEIRNFAFYANQAGKQLGVTGQAFLEASVIFLQQGGLAADYATELAEASIKLSNITGENRDSTSEYITAIANSFDLLKKTGMSAGEEIVDVLASLDAASGSSANEIAAAMKKSASSMAAAGFTMKETAAMISVISETTRQAPEMIGTGLKTVVGRIAEIKRDSQEYGEITSLIQKSLQGFNVEFTLFDEATGDMKKIPALLKEIMKIYQQTGSVAVRNSLIEAVAGKEQRDRFIALVENQERYNELLGIAEGSAGMAERAQAKYLDSVAGRVEQLKAEWEETTLQFFNSDVVKDFVKTLDKVLTLFNGISNSSGKWVSLLLQIGSLLLMLKSRSIGVASAGLFAALGVGQPSKTSVAGGGAGSPIQGVVSPGFRAQMTAQGFTEDEVQTWANDRAALAAAKTAEAQKKVRASFSESTKAIDRYNAALTRSMAATQSLAAITMAFSAVQGTMANNLLSDEEKNTVAAWQIGGAVTNIALQVAGVVASAFAPQFSMAIMGGTSAAGTAIQTVTTYAAQNWVVSQGELDMMEKLATVEAQTLESYKKNTSKIQELLKEYLILSAKIDLQPSEIQRLQQVTGELGQLLPSIITGYDEFNNVIIDSASNVQKVIEGLKEQIDLQEEIYAEKTVKDLGEITAAAVGNTGRGAMSYQRRATYGKAEDVAFEGSILALRGINTKKEAQEYGENNTFTTVKQITDIFEMLFPGEGNSEALKFIEKYPKAATHYSPNKEDLADVGKLISKYLEETYGQERSIIPIKFGGKFFLQITDNTLLAFTQTEIDAIATQAGFAYDAYTEATKEEVAQYTESVKVFLSKLTREQQQELIDAQKDSKDDKTVAGFFEKYEDQINDITEQRIEAQKILKNDTMKLEESAYEFLQSFKGENMYEKLSAWATKSGIDISQAFAILSSAIKDAPKEEFQKMVDSFKEGAEIAGNISLSDSIDSISAQVKDQSKAMQLILDIYTEFMSVSGLIQEITADGLITETERETLAEESKKLKFFDLFESGGTVISEIDQGNLQDVIKTLNEGYDLSYLTQLEKDAYYKDMEEEYGSVLSEQENELLKTRVKSNQITKNQLEVYQKQYELIKKIRGEQEKSNLALTRTRSGGFAFRYQQKEGEKDTVKMEEFIDLLNQVKEANMDGSLTKLIEDATSLALKGELQAAANVLAGAPTIKNEAFYEPTLEEIFSTQGNPKDNELIRTTKFSDGTSIIGNSENTKAILERVAANAGLTYDELVSLNQDQLNASRVSPDPNYRLNQYTKLKLTKEAPALAQGGFIQDSVFANIGEAGRELVLPLDRNTGWIDLLKERMGGFGMGEPITIVHNNNFPSVTSAEEIQRAVIGLSNRAIQYSRSRKSY